VTFEDSGLLKKKTPHFVGKYKKSLKSFKYGVILGIYVKFQVENTGVISSLNIFLGGGAFLSIGCLATSPNLQKWDMTSNRPRVKSSPSTM